MIRLLLLLVALASITQAQAQKISQFDNLPGTAASLGDAVLTQSTSCAAGNCRTTLQQALSALGNSTVNPTPLATDKIVIANPGSSPVIAPLSAIASLVSPSNGLMPSGASDPSTSGTVFYNTSSNRMRFIESGAPHSMVRLDGDTMTGTLGTTGIVQNGTGNFNISLGGSASQLIIKNSGGTPVFFYAPSTGILTIAAGTQSAQVKMTALTSGNTVSLGPQDTSSAWNMRLPANAGTAGALMRIDGTNTASWVQQFRSMDESGAVGNGTTDDTTAIRNFLATFTSGGSIFIPGGRSYLIDSANITIPAGVTLIGAGSPLQNSYAYALNAPSSFVVNPLYTINMLGASQIRSVAIYRKGMTANPSAAQVISGVATWAGSGGTGVTFLGNGTVLTDDLIEGFATGVKTVTSGRFLLSNLWLDNYVSFDMANVGDVSYAKTLLVEPFYGLGNARTSGAWSRPGAGFYIHDGNPGFVLTDSFVFMNANGYIYQDSQALLTNVATEWQSDAGNGLVGAVGYRLLGATAETQIKNVLANGNSDVAVSVEASASVTIDGVGTGSQGVTGVYLSGQTATPATATVTATPSAGQTLSETIIASGQTWSPLTLTYTAVSGDTAQSMAYGMIRLVNLNQSLVAAHIFAKSPSNGQVAIYWPQTISPTVTAGGTATYTTSTGTAQSGSFGILSKVYGNLTPSITAGDSASITGGWVISDPFQQNAGVGPGWISVPNAAEQGSITFSGVHWAPNPVISSCGTSPSRVGTDGNATVTVGSGTVTSCTVTFATPFPWAPNVTMSSQNASVTAVPTSVSTTGFVAAFSSNLGGGKFSFNATP